MSGEAITTIILSILRLSVPIIITALGNMFCTQAGVMNLGAEGMMISGAFGAVLTSFYTGSPWLGAVAGMLCGGIIGLIHSLICVEFGGAQNISGLGLNMLALGLTSFICRIIFGTAISPNVPNLLTTPILGKIPVVGSFLMRLSPIFYLMILIFFICWYIMAKTVKGLRIVAVGSDPKTAETAGINVWKTKHACVILCGLMAGLAGAYLSIGQLSLFVEDMTSGKGMLAIIAVAIGRRKPIRTVLAALMFGIFDALQLQLQINNTQGLPPELIQTIPFVVALITMLIGSGKKIEAVNLNPYLKNKYKF